MTEKPELDIYDCFWELVRQIAAEQKRRIRTVAHWRKFAEDLIAKGVIVDCGPSSSGNGNSIRFQLNRVLSGRLPLQFSGCPSLAELLSQPAQEVPA